MERQTVIAEALRLPSRSRADLAARLIRSLDGEDDESLTAEEWEASWGEEIERRLENHRAGKVKTVAAAEVFQNARKRLKSRRR